MGTRPFWRDHPATPVLPPAAHRPRHDAPLLHRFPAAVPGGVSGEQRTRHPRQRRPLVQADVAARELLPTLRTLCSERRVVVRTSPPCHPRVRTVDTAARRSAHLVAPETQLWPLERRQTSHQLAAGSDQKSGLRRSRSTPDTARQRRSSCGAGRRNGWKVIREKGCRLVRKFSR